MNDFSTLGIKLKNERVSMGLSLGDVAALTGVSKTMLSQIERSESMPTIATMWKIANGLKLKFETLLDNSSELYEVKSINNTSPLIDDNGRILLYPLFPFTPVSGFESFYVIFKPDCNYTGVHQNSIKEHLTIFQGTIDLNMGDKTYHLTAGSAITFDPTDTHRYTNTSQVDAIGQILITY